MNSTHVTVGVSATTATAWLTTLLTGWHGMDAEHATAAAGLITLVAGGVIGVGSTFVQAKWPAIFGGKTNA